MHFTTTYSIYTHVLFQKINQKLRERKKSFFLLCFPHEYCTVRFPPSQKAEHKPVPYRTHSPVQVPVQPSAQADLS